MLRVLVFLSLFVLITKASVAQDENVSLLAQSPHGHTIKMIWFFKKWDKTFSCFDVKRKEGLQQNWVKLNREPIKPEILLNKNLLIVQSDKSEAQRLKSVLMNFISTKKMNEIDSPTFSNLLISDDKFLRDFSKLISEDYDVALISGFGFVDHTITKKMDYEYGLFDHITGKLLATTKWSYGEFPDLNGIVEITSRSSLKRRGIHILWTVDFKKLKAGYVHGFNMYRDGIRLNQDPIPISYTNDLAEYEWFDSLANSQSQYQYGIACETTLDIEGIIKSYTYNPEEHPESYSKAEIANISSQGFYFKDGIAVSWGFPKENEKFIKGFYIEKDNIPAGYKVVSNLIEPTAREFIDKTASPVSSYIKFRTIVIYNDKTKITGSSKLYSYFPIRDPPQPQNLKASTAIINKTFQINLSWDHQSVGDSVTDYYLLYLMDESIDKKMVPYGDHQHIKRNFCSIEIKHGLAQNYRLCVSAVGKNKLESPLSDTLTLPIPTMDVPQPTLLSCNFVDKKVKVEWKYDEFADLKGFRLFINKELIADEEVLHKKSRGFVTDDLKYDESYEFTIQAVTESKLTSEITPATTTTIKQVSPKKKGK